MALLNDRDDELLDELRKLNSNLSSSGSGSESGETEIEQVTNETTVYQGFSPGNLLITESSQMDNANPDGAITVEPGETVSLVEWSESQSMGLLAIGATDRGGVRYSLVVDNDRRIRTYSPLGLINSPFSFIRQLGAPFPAGTTVEYQATLSADATDPVDLAARMFLELDA